MIGVVFKLHYISIRFTEQRMSLRYGKAIAESLLSSQLAEVRDRIITFLTEQYCVTINQPEC
jgi:hypothetical protein